MKDSSFILNLFKASNFLAIAVALIVLLLVYIIAVEVHINFGKLGMWMLKKFGKNVHDKEEKFNRDLEIGKITDKKSKVAIYKFFHELIIDLGIEHTGIRPYELLYFILIGSAVVAIAVTTILFSSIAMIIPVYPMVVAAVICVLYTRSNVAHDARIEAVLIAENKVCNSIQAGVKVAIRDNIELIPEEVRVYFSDFVDNVENKGYYIKTALLELNLKLGSVSDEFIKKCIIFETEEEHGMVGMFADIVELNELRRAKRANMKLDLEKRIQEVKISIAMIFVFILGILIIYSTVRNIYFKTAVGNLIILADMLAMLAVYVICTVVRATEI